MAAAPQVGSDSGSGVNWKTTVAMLLAVVGLGLWVWLGEGELAPTDPNLDSKDLLPHLEAREVVGITVAREGQPTIELTRDPGADAADANGVMGPRGWKLKAPLADEADDAIVARLLNALEFARWIERIPPERQDQVAFGETQLTVRLDRGAQPAYAVTFGASQPTGVTPVRVEGREGTFLLQTTFAQAVPGDLWTYRNKVLFNAPLDDVERLVLERTPLAQGPGVAAREVIEAVKQDGLWRLGQDGDYADKPLVSQVLEHALGLRALAVESDAPTDAQLVELGLAPEPWAKVTVGLPAVVAGLRDDVPREQTVWLGGPVPEHAGQRYARYGDRPYVYRVETGDLNDELAQRKTDEFHSRTLLPIQGAEGSVTGMGAHFAAGDAWRLQFQDGQWVFEGEGEVRASPNPALDLARILIRLESKRLVGHKDELDLGPLGLAESTFWIELVAGDFRHQANVGARVEGKPGHYYVLRLYDGRVFEVDLGLLPQRLRAAPLELLDRRIFRASSYDSQRIQITGPGGEALLDVRRVDASGETLEHWRVDAPPALQAESDTEQIQRFADLFDQVNVDRFMTHDSPEARAKFGLDAPTRVVVTVSEYDDAGQESAADRTLLVGRREGPFVYALNPAQGVIGRIDAGFLDRLQRGFAKGETLMALDRWGVSELYVERDGQELRRFIRSGQNWKQGIAQTLELVDDKQALETLLGAFEKIQVTRADLATTARKAERGLDRPRMRLEFKLLPVGEGDPETRVLLIGARHDENDFEVWATAEVNGQPRDKLGTLFDEPLRVLEAYLDAHPAPVDFR